MLQKINKRRIFSFILAVVFAAGMQLSGSKARAGTSENSTESALEYTRENSYYQYIVEHQAAPSPDVDILIPGTAYIASEGADLERRDEWEGQKDVLLWSNQEGAVEWTVNIPENGLYNMELMYFPLEGKGGDIEFELHIDGKNPFNGAEKFLFPRVWKDETNQWSSDNRGNELRPKQVEVPRWLQKDFEDTEGLYNDAYKFYFSKGSHRIKLVCVKEPIAIKQIRIYQKKSLPSYKEVPQGYNNTVTTEGEVIKIQCEKAVEKSHPTLHPYNDRSNPKTEPYHPNKIRMNVIGGSNWKMSGQTISWEVNIPKDGIYKIGVRYRQNFVRGLYCTRKIYIDGQIPFEELKNVKFPYNVDWGLKVLGDKDPYELYLSEGKHTLTMEVTMGDFTRLLRSIDASVYKLNELYRKIIMITGATPDTFRDYYLEDSIPDLLPSLAEIAEVFKNETHQFEKLVGRKGTEVSFLERIAEQLESMVKYPDTIPERLDNFRGNVSSLAAWALSMKEQPIELDYILLTPKDEKFPKVTSTFLTKIIHEIRAFFGSFIEDYNSVGNVYDRKNSVSVWIGTGRDQAMVLKDMVDNLFSPKTGISVNISLVPGALVQATMAGKGPDVALMVGRGEPVNLASRSALVHLDQFDTFQDVSKRYMPTAMVPYEYDGHYYALPETQDFHMMFYRKDIFAELGIVPPQTWDDLYEVAEALQRNNMNVGLPYLALDAYTVVNTGMGAQSIFPTLLQQNGGQYYNEKRTATKLNDPVSHQAFKQWTDFYTKYGFPLFKDDYNRFRTGEMPLVITNYTFYNMLSTAAPEIRNLWGMLPIPGTEKSGMNDRTASASGTASIMLRDAKNPDAAWKFMDWWTSAEVQARYGKEMEALLGPVGRYNPANKKAFNQIPWSSKDYKMLLEQWANIKEIPEIPGGYYTSRNVDNAFRAVIYRQENPREMLNYWNRQTNIEIAKKRKEFGLDTE